MKNLNQLFLILFVITTLSCERTGKTLEKINVEDAEMITEGNISESRMNDKLVFKIDVKKLENGFHYLNAVNGNKIFVDVSNGEPKGVYITNIAGIVKRGISNLGNNVLEFSCGSWGCSCNGHDDCIDMFGTNVCGGYAVCFGEPPFCICSR
jgi:hypothetical protein